MFARAQAVKEAALAQDALKVIVDLVADPLARHPRMSEKVPLMTPLELNEIPTGINQAERARDNLGVVRLGSGQQFPDIRLLDTCVLACRRTR